MVAFLASETLSIWVLLLKVKGRILSQRKERTDFKRRQIVSSAENPTPKRKVKISRSMFSPLKINPFLLSCTIYSTDKY